MQEFSENKKIRNLIILIIVFFVGAIAMFALVRFNPTFVTQNVTKEIKDVTVTDTGIADAVEKVYDAVVTIETYKGDTLYATGTGFVYKNDGNNAYILTNNHVIESGSEVKVVFTNNKQVVAKVIGADKYADIAVLNVSSKDIITVAEIGKSSDLRVGDTVFAVGAPVDSAAYSWSVTRGILSGKDRMVEVSLSNSNVSDWVMSVMQTDAAINSGNSGGPLCNSNGSVIGINSMKLASSSIEGMGFAIPIEDALDYAEKIESGKKLERPYLGVAMYNLSNMYGRVNTDIAAGVYIDKVEEDSPADVASLKAGDIIVKLDDVDIPNLAYLKYQLYKHNIGDSVKVSFYRGNDLKTTTVNLSKAAD